MDAMLTISNGYTIHGNLNQDIIKIRISKFQNPYSTNIFEGFEIYLVTPEDGFI